MLSRDRIGVVLAACVAVATVQAICLPGLLSRPEERVLYVSPAGRDTWSGRLREPAPDGNDGPVASPARATELVAGLRKAGFRGTIRVVFLPGTYRLDRPWSVGAEASGTESGPTLFEAERQGQAIISGGQEITEWTVRDDGLWQARLDPAGGPITQLFVNGSRRTRARHPNEGYLRTLGPEVEWSSREQARRDRSTKLGIRVRPDDLPDPSEVGQANVLLFHAWTASRHFIASVDKKRGVIRFTAPSNWPVGFWERQQRWYIENLRSALDAPGEWYYDARERALLYYPFEGEDPTSTVGVVPRLEELLVVQGTPDRPVQHVRFRGLRFVYAAWSWPRSLPCDGQAAAFLPTAAVHARHALDCRWEDCTVEHGGTYGLWLDEGTKGSVVLRCRFLDLGAGGVRLGGTALPQQEKRRAERNTVRDCLVSGTGKVFHAGVGVWVGKSSYNTIEHNHICDLYYTGISVGWSWGYAPSSAHHNRIRYNEIHKVGQGVLSDMGGIYTLGISPGTIIEGNYIYDVESYSYGGWGIYPDEGSSYIEITRNLVLRTKTGGFHQHYGRENRVRNNIFAFSRGPQLQRTRAETHISFFFERNLVVYDSGRLMDGRWEDGRVRLDYNLYWNYKGPVVFPGGRSLAEWQQLGQDRHSVVADPLFVDAYSGNFHLRRQSPAFRLGFVPFDAVRKAGPTDPKLRKCPCEVSR